MSGSNLIKVLSIFGTRPEGIKMAPVVKELEKRSEMVHSVVCVTAQHRLMLDQVLEIFAIRPDYDLDIMREDQTLTETTVNVLTKLGSIMEREQPDWVLVQGDTTSAMATSLAAFYRRIKVGHVESGLRTWKKFAPYPEELNRKIVDAVADLHFAPTEISRLNLLKEGIESESIIVTGNTVIDALLVTASTEFMFNDCTLANIPFDTARVILVTAHRRENFGQPLRNICKALSVIARAWGPDVHIVFPVHLNSNVRETVHSLLDGIYNISLVNPLDYLTFVHVMKQSYIILTDSGGLQEEAPSLGKPVLVLRDVTERPEALKVGAVQVIGTEQETIVNATTKLLEDDEKYAQMVRALNPYGDGQASVRIVDKLLNSSSLSGIPIARNRPTPKT